MREYFGQHVRTAKEVQLRTAKAPAAAAHLPAPPQHSSQPQECQQHPLVWRSGRCTGSCKFGERGACAARASARRSRCREAERLLAVPSSAPCASHRWTACWRTPRPASGRFVPKTARQERSEAFCCGLSRTKGPLQHAGVRMLLLNSRSQGLQGVSMTHATRRLQRRSVVGSVERGRGGRWPGGRGRGWDCSGKDRIVVIKKVQLSASARGRAEGVRGRRGNANGRDGPASLTHR